MSEKPTDPRELAAKLFKRPATPEKWAELFKSLFFCEHTEAQMVEAFRAVVEDAKELEDRKRGIRIEPAPFIEELKPCLKAIYPSGNRRRCMKDRGHAGRCRGVGPWLRYDSREDRVDRLAALTALKTEKEEISFDDLKKKLGL